MRIEWNPSNTKKSDLSELLSVLSLSITEFAAALRQAMLTRVDIAFDVSLPLTCFHVVTKSAATTTTKYMQPNGIENYYLGAPKSPHKMVCYDKNIEVHGANRKVTELGQHRILRAKTRCELRLTRIGKISEISNFRNPLKNYIFSDVRKLKAFRADWHWTRFMESCSEYGAQIALRENISQKQRSIYRRIMKSCEPTWYCEVMIWQEAIVELRLLFGDLTLLNP